MRESRLRTIWSRGEAAVNGWLHIASPWAAEAMAHQGFDSLTIDLQHGPLDFQVAISMLQAINTTDVAPLVRVPWNEPGIIGRVLDAGVHGVICPMVNSEEECDAFVSACRYPPRGFRSMGPTRAALHHGSDYAERANETIVTMAMVETAEALENVDAIVGVPGLDAIYVGPGDLALTMRGSGGVDHTDGEMLAALETICRAAHKRGVVAGIHTGSAAYARRMVEMGYGFVTLSSDTRLLMSAASGMVRAYRGNAGHSDQPAASSPY